jgi:probable rRNA maturation factor
MDPSPSPSPALAGIRASPTVIVAEPAWRRAIPGAVALAARAVRAARADAAAGNAADRAAGDATADAAGDTAGDAAGDAAGDPIVVLTTDRVVRRLNARDRGHDKPTNVLTYPSLVPGLRGEIILALGQIRREAAAAARRPAHHLAHLVVHGALHLAGHDHHHAGEARRMELAEARILRRLRVPNPWKRA